MLPELTPEEEEALEKVWDEIGRQEREKREKAEEEQAIPRLSERAHRFWKILESLRHRELFPSDDETLDGKPGRWVTLDSGSKVFIDSDGMILAGFGRGRNIQDVGADPAASRPETKPKLEDRDAEMGWRARHKRD